MIASYFVSMMVTPVACRYFLGDAEHGRLGKAVEAFIDRTADAYSRGLRTVLPYRSLVIGLSAALVLVSGWAASRLPSTFFPEIDEAMDMMYVRFAPGISVEDAAKQLTAMGGALKRELPEGTVEMVVANVGMPQNARSLLVSPTSHPTRGACGSPSRSPKSGACRKREMATRAREIFMREFPGVEVSSTPAASSQASLRTVTRPLRRRGP